MKLHPSHREEATSALRVVAALWGVLLLVWVMPLPTAAKGLANYLPLHMWLETVAIVVSGLIFAIGWNSPRAETSRSVLLLSCVFLGASILDFSHTLSYAGMPDFVTPSGPEKAIHFWLAARTLVAVGLLLASLLPWQARATSHEKYGWLIACAAGLSLLHVLFMAHPAWLPRTFIPGEGLTPFKIVWEYLLVCAYAIAAWRFAAQWRTQRQLHASGLFAAAATMAMAEFFFTLYADVTDLYNLMGHIYKFVAYLFLYWALFHETVRQPYERLRATQDQLAATLAALPDLVFVMDADGHYLEVHSSHHESLEAPPHRLLGHHVSEVMPPAAAQTCMAALEEAQQHGHARGHTIVLDVPEGHRWFELSVSLKSSNDTKGAPQFVVISRDVTERVRHEAAEHQKAQLNSALLSLARVAETQSSEQLLQFLLQQLRALTGSPVACAGFVHTDQQQLTRLCVAVAQSDAEVQTSTHRPWPLPSASVWSEAVAQQSPKVFEDSSALAGGTGLPPEVPALHRCVTLPVFDDGQLRLLAGVGNKATPYTVADLESMQLLVQAVWRYRYKRVAEQRMLILSQALEQSPYPVVVTDLKHRILYINEAFERSSGYGRLEVMGRSPGFLQSGKTPLGTYQDLEQHMRRGESWRGEFINRRKDGGEYIEQVLIYPVRNAQGEITHYLGHKEDITAKKAASARLQHLSHYDQLTGLPNHALLQERFQFAQGEAQHNQRPLTLVWLDLDRFKDINDTLGHAAGDLLLCEVSHRLRSVLRDRDTLARQSGDDFLLLLPDSDQNQAARTATALLEALAKPLLLEKHELVLTASIGLAVYPDDGHTFDELLRCAESAMYRVKQEGRNNYRFFTQELQERSARALAIGNALKLALGREELRLVYQPQISLHHTHLVGAEALLRWQHPQWGPVSPGEFIPVAEASGLSLQIGEWVLRTALRQIRQWLDQGLAVPKIAVNLSAPQFTQTDFAQRLLAWCTEFGVPPALLELELTEAVALQDPQTAVHTMDTLNQAGFALSIDDFGTGYASLSYLKRFAVYKLKIDQSFVRDLVQDADDQAIVTAIIQMAHSLGQITIAEGVETQEQATFLLNQGCDEAQGYLFHRPLEVPAFEALLHTNTRPAA